jgi:raffinose/stachyose/melibiose transport system permease protein
MNKVLGDKTAILIFTLPALLFFLGIIIVPITMSGYYSLLKWDGIGTGSFIGLANYGRLLLESGDGFWQSVLNSCILAALSVFIQLPIALVLALVLASGIRGEGFFRSVYFVPVIVSTVVIGQMWMKIYNPQYGLLNSFFRSVGLDMMARSWLGDTETALMSVFAPLVWQYIGYHMLLMYAAIKSIPIDILEAAKIDGASFGRTSLSITIPLILPMIEVCVVFAVIGSLKSFDLIYVLTNGGPMHATEVPSTLMYGTIFHKYMYGYGSSIAIFIIVECLVLTVAIRQLFGLRKIA